MIHPIDVGYMGVTGAANAFVVRAPCGVVLVECGTARTLPTLERGLAAMGLATSDVSDLLLTHIHLDHAGAAGHLARIGARVHVHPFGERHLVDPAKLVASSRRVHGAAYDAFYGDLLAIDARQVRAAEDGAVVDAAGLSFRALHTPGHARHHVVWMLDQDARRHAFMGDLAGILVPESDHVAMPTPPPEFDPESWERSLERVVAERPTNLWLTHGGCVATDADAASRFLHRARERLRQVVEWLRSGVRMEAAEAERWLLEVERQGARADGVRPRRMDEFIDAAFVRMNLGGARRAFADPA